MANEWKLSTIKLKNEVHKIFEQIQKALEIREKLLLRQIDVLAIQQQQQHHQQLVPTTIVPIDEMKFIAENEDILLKNIRSFGKFNTMENNGRFFTTKTTTTIRHNQSDDYLVKSNTDDRELMYKCLMENDDIEDDGIVVDFTNNKAIIEENANILNENIVHLTLAESRNLIEQSQTNENLMNTELSPTRKEQHHFSQSHDNHEIVVLEENLINNNISTTYNNNNNINSEHSQKKPQKLRLHSCAGTITLNNISNVTINSNCRRLVKKSPDSKPNQSEDMIDCWFSGDADTDDEYTQSYNCEFYKRLMNEIRRTVRKQHNSIQNIPTYNNSMKDSISSSFDDIGLPASQSAVVVTASATKPKNVSTHIMTSATTTTSTINHSTNSSKSINCDLIDNRKIFLTKLQSTLKKLNIPPPSIVSTTSSSSSSKSSQPVAGVPTNIKSNDIKDKNKDYCLHHNFLRRRQHHRHPHDDHHNTSNLTTTHPVQIEEWLRQIFLDTEIEPMQNVEILEHSNLTKNSQNHSHCKSSCSSSSSNSTTNTSSTS